MSDSKIKNKILNNQELTNEEVQHIAWVWEEELFDNRVNYHWWESNILVYKINDKYYSIQCYDNEENRYPAQIAIQIKGGI